MESLETLATILAITRVGVRGLSQPERVQELLAADDPGEVLDSISQRPLFDDPVLERARNDVEEWIGQGVGVVSVLSGAYPARLRADIAESGGLVMTQFEPGATVTRANFPMRNAVMSGYGITTFVVAAGERSGTRVQAAKAVEHGRGVILARRVVETTSWGRELARTGRALVADRTDDILAQVHDLQAERARAEDLLRELTA